MNCRRPNCRRPNCINALVGDASIHSGLCADHISSATVSRCARINCEELTINYCAICCNCRRGVSNSTDTPEPQIVDIQNCATNTQEQPQQ